MPWKSIEEKRAYDKQYRESHREQIKESMRRYRIENKQRLAAYNKEWAQNNIEHVRDESKKRQMRWRHRNPERHKENVKERKLRTIKALWDYKEERGCSQCSEKDPRCLDFHHRNPEEKSYNISHGLSNKLSLETLMIEISKCDLLCRNCHIKLNKRIWIKN